MIFHYIIESCFLSRSPGMFPPFQRHLADVGSVVVPVPHVGEPAGHHVVRCNQTRLVRLPLNRDTKQNINHSWGQFYGIPNLHFAAALSATFCLICLETSQGRIRLWWKILVIKNIKTKRSKIWRKKYWIIFDVCRKMLKKYIYLLTCSCSSTSQSCSLQSWNVDFMLLPEPECGYVDI